MLCFSPPVIVSLHASITATQTLSSKLTPSPPLTSSFLPSAYLLLPVPASSSPNHSVLPSHPQIRTICIIAEGIPENLTRKLNAMAAEKQVTIIGPATVGGIKPGCFKIGNTGGMLDNILSSKLFRPGR